MTTSLPTASPETQLAGATAATSANALLDLFAAALPGQTIQNAEPGSVVATDGFAALLAPAKAAAPVPAAPQAASPVVVPAATPAAATAPAPQANPALIAPGTSVRALRLPGVAESAPSAPVTAPGEEPAPTTPDRSTIEAALAMVATLWPAATTPASLPVGPEATAATSVPNLAPCANSAESPHLAGQPRVLVTLTSREGVPVSPTDLLPEPALPSGQAAAAAKPRETDLAPTVAAAPAPRALADAPAPVAPATMAATPKAELPAAAPTSAVPTVATAPVAEIPLSSQPVRAEFIWENGLKLTAELAPALNPTQRDASRPAGHSEAKRAATVNLPTTAVTVAQLNQAEKNAASLSVPSGKGNGRESTAEKNFLTIGTKAVTTDSAQAGISVADSRAAMPAAPHHLPPVAPAATPVTPTDAGVERQGTGESLARRAVDTVVEIVHAQVVARMQPAPSVQLRFKVGHEDLAVRVQLRDGEVHTEFRTDNAELRAAVTQEWRAVTAKPEAALRFLDPVFQAAQSTASQQPGGNASQHHHQHAQAQQHQQQQQQQFRAQLELFGSVRRPAVPALTDLAPVTPLPASSSHRLSAVA